MKPFESPPKKLVFAENITNEKKGREDSEKSKTKGKDSKEAKIMESQQETSNSQKNPESGNEIIKIQTQTEKRADPNRDTKKIFIPQKLEEIGFDSLKDFLTR